MYQSICQNVQQWKQYISRPSALCCTIRFSFHLSPPPSLSKMNHMYTNCQNTNTGDHKCFLPLSSKNEANVQTCSQTKYINSNSKMPALPSPTCDKYTHILPHHMKIHANKNVPSFSQKIRQMLPPHKIDSRRERLKACWECYLTRIDTKQWKKSRKVYLFLLFTQIKLSRQFTPNTCPVQICFFQPNGLKTTKNM